MFNCHIWLAEGTCTILYLNIPMMSSFPSSDVQLRYWKWVPRARTCHRSGRDLASPGSLQKFRSFQQHIFPCEWNIHPLLVGIRIGCKTHVLRFFNPYRTVGYFMAQPSKSLITGHCPILPRPYWVYKPLIQILYKYYRSCSFIFQAPNLHVEWVSPFFFPGFSWPFRGLDTLQCWHPTGGQMAVLQAHPITWQWWHWSNKPNTSIPHILYYHIYISCLIYIYNILYYIYSLYKSIYIIIYIIYNIISYI